MPSQQANESLSAQNTPSASGSASSSSAKSLFARIKAPFGSKTRNFTDFHIEPDDPHRQYNPGDIVSGSVVLRAVKPVRITHLVISLHGFVQVFKSPNNPGDGFRTHNPLIATGKGTKEGGYFGNGFASLFQDELVLCGEGRLKEGVYQFRFELEFPRKGLPSSIDFERGTVSYMLTSTLTRPTALGPTVTCDRKIYMAEEIDIAHFSDPTPRVISLEPIARKSKRPGASRRSKTQSEGTGTLGSESGDVSRPSRILELSSIDNDSTVPESPAPSDISFDSQTSNLTSSGDGSGEKSTSVNTAANSHSAPKRNITATIEIGRSAFLRGDSIPLKISVQHTKRILKPRGIIVTFYRQARVDMNPALPVTTPGKATPNISAEDYYPKSKTGLGGLSLSSAGSSHIFRKDLSQSFAALIVNPQTLIAEVRANVRIPEEAFPTISNVPGSMISFKYYVEVVVDIQGKINGLDKYVPTGSTFGLPTTYVQPSTGSAADDIKGSLFSALGANFLDTEEIRRDKSIVSCVFEVIIGTKNSERAKGKRRATIEDTNTTPTNGIQPYYDQPPPHQQSPYGRSEIPSDARTPGTVGAFSPSYDPTLNSDVPLHHSTEQRDHYYTQQYTPAVPSYDEISSATPRPYVPATPALPDESTLSEKQRLQLAETRLLPSQPPMENGTSSAVSHAPSAPFLYTAHSSGFTPTPSLPILATNTTPGPSRPPEVPYTNGHGSQHVSHEPSAPGYDTLVHSSTSAAVLAASDDKHELHRRRLEMERSAPDDFPEMETGSLGRTTNGHAISVHPSAPPASGTDDGDVTPSAPPLQDVEPPDGDDHYRMFGLHSAHAAASTSASVPSNSTTAAGISATTDGSIPSVGNSESELPRYER